MKKIRTVDAIGHVLCHDITQIIPGVYKGPVFKKGHVIEEKDIPVLLSVGKEYIYILENNENMVHENDAAYRLLKLCGQENMISNEPSEGKIELTAAIDGVFFVDNQRLNIVNSVGEMMISTRQSGFFVKKGDKLAGMRVIPLLIENEKLENVEKLVGNEPLLKLVPIKKKRYGLVTTGNEVFSGRIKDAFTPILNKKLALYGAEMVEHIVLDDNPEKITESILKMLSHGVDMVICTGGMSVDPDDRTPLAIKNTGANIISYGAPVLPGAMFLMSYYKDGRPIMGLPGCVMYAKRTVFDLVLPRILTDTPVTKNYLANLGHGGLCLNCDICTFPNCGFGKGGTFNG